MRWTVCQTTCPRPSPIVAALACRWRWTGLIIGRRPKARTEVAGDIGHRYQPRRRDGSRLRTAVLPLIVLPLIRPGIGLMADSEARSAGGMAWPTSRARRLGHRPYAAASPAAVSVSTSSFTISQPCEAAYEQAALKSGIFQHRSRSGQDRPGSASLRAPRTSLPTITGLWGYPPMLLSTMLHRELVHGPILPNQTATSRSSSFSSLSNP